MFDTIKRVVKKKMKLSALLHSKLFIGIAAGVTAAAAATTAFFLTRKSDEEYRVIKVFEKTGTSIVTRPDVGDIKPYVGMNLESGDSVCTYKDSTMRISLDNTKYMFMEPETKLELEASGDKNDNRTKIILKSGSVLNEITKPLSSDSSYVVSAPKASMAVHGTSFRVFVEKVGDDYIITLYAFEGTVKVTLLDENGNDTNKTASVSKDKCIKIKTVHNSSKDPSEDGTSFFVYQNEKGELDPVPEGKSPIMDFNYEDIPYETLKEVFDTDKGNELKLSPEVLQKVIDAMTKGGGDPNETTTTTVTTGETTTTTEEETTTTPEETTTTPEETTTTGEETTTTPKETTTTLTETTVPPETTTTQSSAVTTTTSETTSTQSSTGTTPVTSETTDTTTSENVPPAEDLFTVKFVDRSGNVISSQTVKKGKSAQAPSNITQSYTSGGWTMLFDGWDKDYTNVQSDLTIKPVYKAKQRFTVTFYDYNGSVLSTQTVEKDNGASEPEDYTKTYVNSSTGRTMVFDGWDTDFSNIQADTSVKPVYKAAAVYTVTFYGHNGEKLSTQEVEQGKSATKPADPESYTDDDGWTMEFDKWDTDFTNVQKDLKVTAVYKARARYTVQFYTHGGVKYGSAQTVEKGKSATKPANPSSYTDDDGWTMEFDKWDTDFTNVQKDLKVTAVYKARARYTVQFYTHGGVKYGSAQTVEKGKSATKPASPSSYTDDDGWTMEFDKWDTDFTNVQKNLDVTAEYKARARYTVQFYTHGGVKYGSAQTVEKGKSATKPTNPSSYTDDDGWTMEFDKWDTDFTDVQKDLDVTAEYKARARYTVQFYTHGGVKYGSAQTVEKGQSATKPTDPESYTDGDGISWVFDKWDTSFSKVEKDLDVTAVYKRGVLIRFLDYSKTVVKKQIVEKGGSGTPPTVPETVNTSDGTLYFGGWTDYTNVEEDCDSQAIYGKHTHVSLYDMRGNSPDSSMTPSEEQVAGSKFVLPDYVTSGDYNEGWFQSTSGMKATSTEPTDSATLSNDSNENIYLLLRYSNSPFEEYVNDVLETSAECTMFRDTDGSYYFVSGEGAYLSTAICDSSGNGTVNGIPLNACTFETNFGSNVSYSTLYTLMQDKTNNVKVTKVRLDLLKDPNIDDY